MKDSQADVIAFLSGPAAYGLEDQAVERHETHGSIVFLAGEFAYKLKRSVKYPYLDYSTVQRRREMCGRELEINRRMTPELYIGIRPLVHDAHGKMRFGADGDEDRALDWVVVMRRFGQADLLEQMRRRALLSPALMQEVGARIASFHAAAEVRLDRGGAAGILAVIEENNQLLLSMVGWPFAAEKVEQFARLSQQCFAARRAALDRRQKEGHVRRVHGDLHLNNICMFDGRPVPFDAIEFSEDFACIDTLYDLAFLLMDLDLHGLCICANILFNRYLDETQDYDGIELMPLFMSCRAAIRAHVSVSAAAAIPEKEALLHAEAIALLDRAISYLLPFNPMLIAIGGVSGTGKSTLAYHVAPLVGRSPGAIVLRSDVLRKRLWGADPRAPLPETAYTTEITERVFQELARCSEALLRAGYSVIADAVFREPEQRNLMAAVAGRTNAAFHGLWLEGPLEMLESRVAGRKHDASDATVAILRQQLKEIIPPSTWARFDVACSKEEAAAQIVRALWHVS